MASHFNEIHLLLEQNDRDVDLIRRLRKGLLNGSSSPRKLSCLCYNLCFMIKFHFKTLSNKLHLGLNQLNYQHNNKSNKILSLMVFQSVRFVSKLSYHWRALVSDCRVQCNNVYMLIQSHFNET